MRFNLGYLPPRLPTTCLSMPPRFDRDIPNTMPAQHHSGNQMMTNGQTNGMMCAPSSNGSNNPLLNGLGNNVGSNGGIGSVSASLRKPLLEINGSFMFKKLFSF